MAARRRFRADVPMKRFTHWRAWLAPVVSLVILNASLTFENVWPTPRIRWGHAVSLELALCVLILAVAHRWASRLARRVLPAIWIVLVAGRYLDVTAPGLYGRDFNLYWDSPYLGNVTAMLARAAPWWLIAAAAAVAVLGGGLAGAPARLAFGGAAGGLGGRGSPLRARGLAGGPPIVVFRPERSSPGPSSVSVV